MVNSIESIALRKVLVVDDNPVIQRTVYLALRERGFAVVMTGEIMAALKLIREDRMDAILLDLNFPAEAAAGGENRDGFWALEWLRRQGATEGIPIIIVSSDPLEKSMARALAEGAAAYLQKPLNMAELAAMLGGIIPPRPAVD